MQIHILLFFYLLISIDALSTPQTVAKVHGWKVVRTTQGKKSSCYMVARPYKSTGKNRCTKKPYVMISFSQKHSFVNLCVGTPLKSLSKVNICPGGKCHTLYAKKDRAWAANAKDDKKIIDDMKKYKFLQASPAGKKPPFKDHYSLKGFQKAYKAMLLCSKP